jgi:enoyl-CoA hydratase/carnithine racemase
LDAPALLDELRGDYPIDRAGPVMVVLRPGDPDPDEAALARLASLPIIVITVAQGSPSPQWQALSDVLVTEDDPSLDDIEATVTACPIAAVSLAMLLRGGIGRTVGDGLVAESAVYSALQGGPEFAAWRAGTPMQRPPENDAAPRVSIVRDDAVLVVTMSRPERLNALDARMRDELLEGLTVARVDPSITHIELRGEGRAFSSGGDLNEFGIRSDPATAHILRLQRSVSRVLHEVGGRATAFLHGPCVGSGIELAAFCGTVLAKENARISLPEVRLGLVPGAGGTVSMARRIGRQRTAWLALSGRTIDAATALEWGLVDAIDLGDD